MKKISWYLAFTSLVVATTTASAQVNLHPTEVIDAQRNRTIPVMLYQNPQQQDKTKLAVISHGYGGQYTAYSFVAEHLANQGFIVASIQHALPGDPPLVIEGDPKVTRRPNWQSGVDDIRAVVASFQSKGIVQPEAMTVLVGHSNGGDTTMLYATEFPEAVQIAFTLDHRRMPVPRTSSPRICSLRSSDYEADQGVFPTVENQEALGMMIWKAKAIQHNDMWDGATDSQKSSMLKVLNTCLNG
ncbi:serine aminopeptidase domain-containing protein [Kiloniella sp.]|uniref:serine aminopeptidase domain-containing protein n=1 Tax=Kiloniella sp. TaxID=1938587 RepID=UPI003A943D32